MPTAMIKQVIIAEQLSTNPSELFTKRTLALSTGVFATQLLTFVISKRPEIEFVAFTLALIASSSIVAVAAFVNFTNVLEVERDVVWLLMPLIGALHFSLPFRFSFIHIGYLP